MSQPAHPDPASASADANAVSDSRNSSGEPDQSERQNTLLLSDVPEASALMPEADATVVAPAPEPSAPQVSEPQPKTAQFPTLDLSPLAQRYELLAEAGHGSMGHVYKARDRETGETVALKLLKPEIASDQSMMERFKKELLFARKITHKNVCRVHEFNRIGGIAFTSMEFVEGDSLRSILNRFGGLPQRKALDLALQMCSALQEAHAQGIVHRDLKPENVMIDAQGNVKIMDFGIARSMDAMTRMTGSMMGTPAYMAPEQVAGKPVDFRTDIYALGLILYEMFTGRPALQAENAVAVALKQMREAPTPPRKIDASIPFGIERAIMKCLEKEPARRFQSVAQLADALRTPAAGASAGAPIMAPAVGAATGGTAHPAPDHSTHGVPLAPHPLYGVSAMAAPEPKRHSVSGWILLLLVLAGSAYGAMHWDQVVRAEREYKPLTISAAKYYYAQAKSYIHKTPAQNTSQADAQANTQTAAQPNPSDAEAAEIPASVAQSPATPSSGTELQPSDAAVSPSETGKPAAKLEKTHGPAVAQVSKSSAPSASKSRAASTQRSAVSTATNPPVAKAAPPETRPHSAVLRPRATAKQVPSVPANRVPSAVRQRAEDTAGKPGTLSVPPVNNHSPSYLWIGWFRSEDRAQVTAKKVEELGLPVAVIPRHTRRGSFYVVLSGPFGPERVGSVMEWLKEQGFRGIRVLKNPLRNGRLIRGVEQDPD